MLNIDFIEKLEEFPSYMKYIRYSLGSISMFLPILIILPMTFYMAIYILISFFIFSVFMYKVDY